MVTTRSAWAEVRDNVERGKVFTDTFMAQNPLMVYNRGPNKTGVPSYPDRRCCKFPDVFKGKFLSYFILCMRQYRSYPRKLKNVLANVLKKILKNLEMHIMITLKAPSPSSSGHICASVKKSMITKQQQPNRTPLGQITLTHYPLRNNKITLSRILSLILRCRQDLWLPRRNRCARSIGDRPEVCRLLEIGVRVLPLHLVIWRAMVGFFVPKVNQEANEFTRQETTESVDNLLGQEWDCERKSWWPVRQPCHACCSLQKRSRGSWYALTLYIYSFLTHQTDKEYRKGIHWLETLRLRRTKILEAGYTVSCHIIPSPKSDSQMHTKTEFGTFRA